LILTTFLTFPQFLKCGQNVENQSRIYLCGKLFVFKGINLSVFLKTIDVIVYKWSYSPNPQLEIHMDVKNYLSISLSCGFFFDIKKTMEMWKKTVCSLKC